MRIVNDILKLDHLQWLLDRSDLRQFYNLDCQLDIRRITRRFHGTFAWVLHVSTERLVLTHGSASTPPLPSAVDLHML